VQNCITVNYFLVGKHPDDRPYHFFRSIQNRPVIFLRGLPEDEAGLSLHPSRSFYVSRAAATSPSVT
jgi:hypothetical protein